MVKFSDINNDNISSTKPIPKKKRDESKGNSRLSFRKLAAEQKKALSADKVVSEKKASDKDQIGVSGKVLYEKSAAYLKQAFEAVKRRKMFSLDPGFQIIREMVEMQSFQDSLFIEALHLDDPLKYVILNNVNVAIYAIKMADNLGLSKDRQVEIGMAGLLHDIGMAIIPEKLIYKQQKLSEAEFKIFKERSNYSYKILKAFGDDYPYLAECAAQVNERLDGSGYPQGLKGDEIHEYAQIIGLVDMYEALIHSRPQREKFLHFIAVKEIIKTGKNLFQRKHLKALLNIFSIFPLHSYVKLNSNAVCKVIETYPDQPMRPRVQIVFDSQQRRVLTERIINLPDDQLLYIVDSVSDEELQSPSEGPDSKTRARAERVQKSDDLHSMQEEATFSADEFSPEMQEKEERTGREQKVGWFKAVLLIGGIALLATGLIIQLGNKDSKPLDAGKLQTSVMKTKPGSTLLKEPVDISLPSINKSEVQKEVAQQKPAASQIPDSKDLRSSNKAIVGKATPKSSVTGAVTSEESVFNKERESISIGPLPDKESLETSSKYGMESVSTKRLYPYSIRLDAFRSRQKADKTLAIYREKGLSPYWVKVDLGDKGVWYRIFTGYFDNVKQAGKVIKASKLKGAAIKKTKYATLIGTYRSETTVNDQIKLISKEGFSPYVVKGSNNIFYLYVGAFYTHKGAEDQYADLLADGIESKIVER
ncbi:MAG: HD domain-containing phosphohydrolase [Candidatus Desulfatibia sp.]|uniref:HD domain-containing phosphohydrolase n=1 Tax=Candidatus Desulfatibia sp. TaxID=3101189 RepID=UPI002F333343